MVQRLFVYGTLKMGQRNAHLMCGKCLGQVRTALAYQLIDFGSFPGFIKGNLAIVGELWEVDEVFLEELDIFEGVHRGVYSRELIQLEDGTEAYAYCSLIHMPAYDGNNWHERQC